MLFKQTNILSDGRYNNSWINSLGGGTYGSSSSVSSFGGGGSYGSSFKLKSYTTSEDDIAGHWNVNAENFTLEDGAIVNVKISTFTFNNNEGYNTINVSQTGDKLIWADYDQLLIDDIDLNDELTLVYRADCGKYTITSNTGNLEQYSVVNDGYMIVNRGSLFQIDDEGNIYTTRNFYSLGQVSAFGKATGGSGNEISLSMLKDVKFDNLKTGQILKFNGTDWVNAADGGGGGGTSNVEWGTPLEDRIPLTVDGISQNLLTAHQSLSECLKITGGTMSSTIRFDNPVGSQITHNGYTLISHQDDVNIFGSIANNPTHTILRTRGTGILVNRHYAANSTSSFEDYEILDKNNYTSVTYSRDDINNMIDDYLPLSGGTMSGAIYSNGSIILTDKVPTGSGVRGLVVSNINDTTTTNIYGAVNYNNETNTILRTNKTGQLTHRVYTGTTSTAYKDYEIFDTNNFNNWFKKDADGKIYCEVPFYSTMNVSAYGTGNTINPSLTINDLTNVNISSPANNQALLYDNSLKKWVNKVIPESGSKCSFGTKGSDYVPITIDGITNNVLTKHQSLAGYLPKSGGTMSGTINYDSSTSIMLKHNNTTLLYHSGNTNTIGSIENENTNTYLKTRGTGKLYNRHYTDVSTFTNHEILDTTWFKKDSDGNIYCEVPFYSTQNVSAYGKATNQAVNTLENLVNQLQNRINELESRIQQLENK